MRIALVAMAAVVAAASAGWVLRPERGVPDDAPTLDAMADVVGAEMMQQIFRGHVAGRSGEIMLVPKPHRFVIGEWDLTALGTDRPYLDTAHSYAWSYLTRVPLVLYGPGFVPTPYSSDDPLDIASLAPTYARLVGLEEFESESDPLPGPMPRPDQPPKVIFTVVIDGGGWNVLREHPLSWPVLRDLRAQGASYDNVILGSFPSITGGLHATFGSGFYPRTHGLPGNQLRAPGGDPTVDAWLDDADPRFLEVPTVAELWDEANDNQPVVATVSYEGWHLGMIGHGAQRSGGDRDIAVLWRTEENTWWINESFYEIPDYLLPTEIGLLERYEAELDLRDGVDDDLWFGHDLSEIRDSRKRPGSPAFARFTGDAVMQILRNESIGRDALTDFVWIEMKQPDFGGHLWNMINPEQSDILWEVDRQIGRFKRWLDEHVPGDYVLAVSADHGQQPLPETVGGWRINSAELERDIGARFGADVVEKITPVEIYVDRDLATREEIPLEDIARYLGTYTIGDNVPEGAPGAERVPDGRLDEKLFAAAFPTGYIESLTEETIAEFGDSIYPEGRLFR